MKILVAEDNDIKLNILKKHLLKYYPNADVIESRSMSSTNKILLSDSIDIVLLDMSMPTFDAHNGKEGGKTRALAGRDVISKMYRRKVNVPIIVVTRFDVYVKEKITIEELDIQLKNEYPSIYKGYVFFDQTSSEWSEKLNSKIDLLSKI